MDKKTAARSFSTAAHFPTMAQASSRKPSSMRWVVPAAAVVGIGYGINTYREAGVERRQAAASAAQQAEAERQRRNEMMLDAYGDRSSLEALEKAAELYSSKS